MKKTVTNAHTLLNTIVTARCERDIKSALKSGSNPKAIARLERLQSWEQIANIAVLGRRSTVRFNLTAIYLHLARLNWKMSDGSNPRRSLSAARRYYEQAISLAEDYRDLHLQLVSEYQMFVNYESRLAWNTVKALEAILDKTC